MQWATQKFRIGKTIRYVYYQNTLIIFWWNSILFLNKKHCEIWKYSSKFYFKKNAVRGVIASVCCAVFFILIGLVYKFRWKSLRDDDEDEQEMSGKHQNINISHFFIPIWIQILYS